MDKEEYVWISGVMCISKGAFMQHYYTEAWQMGKKGKKINRPDIVAALNQNEIEKQNLMKFKKSLGTKL